MAMNVSKYKQDQNFEATKENADVPQAQAVIPIEVQLANLIENYQKLNERLTRLENAFGAFDRQLYKVEYSLGTAQKEVSELRQMVDEVYLPIKRERQAAARARLAARNDTEDEEDDI